MSVVSVKSQTELLSALKTAQAGDTISLAPGNYGKLNLDATKYDSRYLKYSGEVKIVSADITSKAVIEGLTLTAVSNLKFQSINFDYRTASTSGSYAFIVNSSKNVSFRGDKFGGEYDANGYGVGVGLKVSQGSNVLVENSTFTGFKKGIEGWATSGLTIKGNTINDISYDGIVTGHVQGLTITDNAVSMKSNPAFDIHRDVIQIYNLGTAAPSSNILIANNKLDAPDGVTHGIYIDNVDARTSGSLSEFYQNIVIRDNTIQTSQKLGIAIGEADGVTVTGNTLIQNDARADNPSQIAIPLLHIEQDARDVTVTNNIFNGAPIAADSNWGTVVGATNDWTLRDNAIVKLNWQIGDSTVDPWANVQGNGEADAFRFKGTWVASGDRTDDRPDVSFSEGDTITLINYEQGTFKGVWKGNPLTVSTDGTYVKIDSITDLQEVVGTSPKLSATVSDDVLTLHVIQSGGEHDIVLDGLGVAYASTYDSSLF